MLSVGLDPIPSLSFDMILTTHEMLFSSKHKGKVRETFTPCYESQNFWIEKNIRYEQVLGIELVFALGNLCVKETTEY